MTPTTMIPSVGRPIRVLLVEDNPGDARLIVEMLRDVDQDFFDLQRVDRLEPALERLGEAGIDVVLLDLGLPGSEGLETFERARSEARGQPIVVLSGLDDEGVALEAVRGGAQDYLVKGRIDGRLLARVIRYALERTRTERDLKEREEQFRQLSETMREVYYLMEADLSEALFVSSAYERLWGRPREALYEDAGAFMDAVLPEDRTLLKESMERVRRTGEQAEDEFRIRRPGGEVRWVLARTSGVLDDHGRVYRVAGVALDITDRKEAEQGLRASEARLRSLMETMNLLVLGLEADGTVDYANPFLLEVTGFERGEVLGRSWIDRLVAPDERERIATIYRGLVAGEEHTHFRSSIVTRAGEERTIAWHNTVLRDRGGEVTGVISVGEDVTEQARLQAQLEQAQKMEAVGRLAGGIAHDFNNLLTAILAPSELLLLRMDDDDPRRADVEDIRGAAERAAGLTGQLLAFSRRQVLEPQLVDLNELLTNLDRMLRRVIGEDVELRTRPAPGLGVVRADPGQLEQVLLNLVVNSRDAMPTGGMLTLETGNVELDEAYAEDHIHVEPGDYVMLAVTDSGTGMDEETRRRVFEPFYTTKTGGKGTGLGLATAYGIVKQAGGHIWVYSEVDQGTTIKVYLPRVDQPAEPLTGRSHEAGPTGGTETLLVVEDDAAVRDVTRRILEGQGYRVLVAAGGHRALEMVAEHPGDIPLLITDVVMPEMSGRELSERLEELCPGIRTVFMSGYTDDTVVHHGVLARDVHFIQKPFTPKGLARKVRKVLDGDARKAGPGPP